MKIIDLHAHFPMHLHFPPRSSDSDVRDHLKELTLWGANLILNYRRGQPRITGDLVHKGHVGAFASVLYDPDDEFFRQEAPRPEAFANLAAQIAQVEFECQRAGIAVARSADDVQIAIDAGTPALFHSVEGAFALGGDPSNVKTLAERGIAYMTVAHLFFRSVATCCNGIPFLPNSLYDSLWPQPKVGLTELGKQIVRDMFEHRIIVDIVHLSPTAIDDVFTIAASYDGRPIIATHTGVREISNHVNNITDETIRRVASTDGVVGIILCPYWLTPSGKPFGGALEDFFKTVDHVKRVTGSLEYVCIGTDVDGFCSSIKEIRNYGDIPVLEQAIRGRYGSDADKILYKNVLRVLRAGWR
jgi:microsomal dipeptidase-like Zn-dependent dipeptidase